MAVFLRGANLEIKFALRQGRMEQSVGRRFSEFSLINNLSITIISPCTNSNSTLNKGQASCYCSVPVVLNSCNGDKNRSKQVRFRTGVWASTFFFWGTHVSPSVERQRREISYRGVREHAHPGKF